MTKFYANVSYSPFAVLVYTWFYVHIYKNGRHVGCEWQIMEVLKILQTR